MKYIVFVQFMQCKTYTLRTGQIYSLIEAVFVVDHGAGLINDLVTSIADMSGPKPILNTVDLVAEWNGLPNIAIYHRKSIMKEWVFFIDNSFAAKDSK